MRWTESPAFRSSCSALCTNGVTRPSAPASSSTSTTGSGRWVAASRLLREALRAGIGSIEWTYDPLRSKNAFFNIERLGAVARRYSPDHYGQVQSRFQQGLPSDRLVAEWWLKSPRVKRALAGKSPRQPTGKPAAVVAVPADFTLIAKTRPAEARRLQLSVREQLQCHFARKLVITAFAFEGGAGRYVLDPARAAGLGAR